MVLGPSNEVSIMNKTQTPETGYSYQNCIKSTGQIINLGHVKLNIWSPYNVEKRQKPVRITTFNSVS